MAKVKRPEKPLVSVNVFPAVNARWEIGVSGEGHITQSVEVRPRSKDSGLVAWEAPWRESKTVEPSDVVHLGCTATHQVVTCESP
jgi:hypothetical protein